MLLDVTKSRDGTAACASAVHAHTATNNLSVNLHEAVQSTGSNTAETTIDIPSLLNGKITAKHTASVESVNHISFLNLRNSMEFDILKLISTTDLLILRNT